MSDKTIPIKISSLILIGEKLLPTKIKVNSLLEDYYQNIFPLSRGDLINLLELKISIEVLALFLEDLESQATEAKVESLFLKTEEITMMAGLVRAIGATETLQFGNTTLVTH